jgi:glycosyltransferase involved in cell wall biosynthesis
MPALTALLHTENDALRLGRCLETLYPCDHILIVDHSSRDATVDIARQYGARVVQATSGGPPDHSAQSATPGWILALDPRESLTEGLAASLFELKLEWKQPGPKLDVPSVYSVFLREETAAGWIEHPISQTRLVPHDWNHWSGNFPAPHSSAVTLEGELLRFAIP